MRKTSILMLTIVLMLVVMLAGTVAADTTDGMLSVTSVEVDVDSDDESSADEDGGSMEVRPESFIKMKVEVTSLFDDNIEGEDVEIRNVEVEAVIEDVDGDDIDDYADDFDLDPGDDKKVTLEFQLPLRLETDEIYALVLTITAEDQNDTEYEIKIEYDVEVDKENHELRFLQKEIYPESIKTGNSAQVRVKLINTGEEDEDVTFTVEAQDLGFSYSEEFELVEDVDDDENEFSFNGYIPVRKGTAAGSYPVNVKAMYRDGREFLEHTLYIVVEEETVVVPPTPTPTPTPIPAPVPEPEEEEEDEVEVITQPVNTQSYVMPGASSAVATPRTSYSTAGDSWWDKNKWITIILITDLILLIVGVAIVLAVLRRRRG